MSDHQKGASLNGNMFLRVSKTELRVKAGYRPIN